MFVLISWPVLNNKKLKLDFVIKIKFSNKNWKTNYHKIYNLLFLKEILVYKKILNTIKSKINKIILRYKNTTGNEHLKEKKN